MTSFSRLAQRGKATPTRFLHDGTLFRHMDVTGTVGNGANFDIILQTPGAGTAILLDNINFSLGGTPFDVEVREGVTFSNAGTTITPLDANRKTANTSLVTLSSGPTVTTTGTKILKWKALPGAGQASPLAGDDEQIEGAALVLAESTDYLIRLTNNSGGTAGGTVSIQWAELPD